jgi:hypothetical protein
LKGKVFWRGGALVKRRRVLRATLARYLVERRRVRDNGVRKPL